MGVTVRQKVKGRGKPWWVFIAHNGKRKSIKVGSKDAANELKKEMDKDLARGKLNLEEENTEQIPTFKEYSEKWVNGYVKATLSESTYERYEQVLKSHIWPTLSGTPLDKINRGDVKDLLISKANDGLSHSSISTIKDVISGVFECAIDEELIDAKNPTAGITKKMKLGRKKKIDASEVLSKEEVSLFLDTCKNHFPYYYSFFLMTTRTGMRLGELLAIRWGDIDFNSKTIWIRQAYRRKRITLPKGNKVRPVDMSDQLGATLRELLTRAKKQVLKQGLGEVPDLIFHRNGRIIEQNYIRRVFKRILKKAELREIKIHSLRHTFASLLLSEGESPVYVKEQLGHSSIKTTVDIYGHWIQTKSKTGVNRLDTVAPACTLSAPNQEKSHLSA